MPKKAKPKKKAKSAKAKLLCYRCNNPVATGRRVCAEHVDAEDQKKANAAGVSVLEWRERYAADRKQALMESARKTAIETKAKAAERLLGELAAIGWEVPKLDEEDYRRPYAVSPGEGWRLGFAKTGTPFLRDIALNEEGHVLPEAIFIEVDIRGLTVEELVTSAKASVVSFRRDYALRRAEQAEERALQEIVQEGKRVRQAASDEQFLVNVHRNVGKLAGDVFRERLALGRIPTSVDERNWACVRADYRSAPAFCDGGASTWLSRSSPPAPPSLDDDQTIQFFIEEERRSRGVCISCGERNYPEGGTHGERSPLFDADGVCIDGCEDQDSRPTEAELARAQEALEASRKQAGAAE
jgi:hypothetical protein